MFVPGGGLAKDGSRWVSCRPNFLLPVRVLSKLFRRLMLTKLAAAHEAGAAAILRRPCTSRRRQGVRCIPCPAQKQARVRLFQAPVRRAKGRACLSVTIHTHRVAISNRRLIALNERQVTFKVKDYWIEGPDRYTTMTLDIGEFIRRFLIHVLPRVSTASVTMACSPAAIALKRSRPRVSS
jgi:Putative transposase